jgi:hypothetical protein
MSRIVIAGDIYAGGSNEALLMNADCDAYAEVSAVLRSADFAVANLEAPLAVDGAARRKLGPNLRAHPQTAKGLADIGISAFCLANNHIMDYGVVGLDSTTAACRENSIAFFGAGANIAAAGSPVIAEIDGLRIGFLGVAEHDGVVATRTEAGPLHADPLLVHRWILDNRCMMDRLVVLLHGSLEHFPYPTPRVRALCRYLVDCGADAVICQHTHIIGCEERYRDAPILYGQGNFMFDYMCPRDTWWVGLLAVLDFDGTAPTQMSYQVVESSSAIPGVRLAVPRMASAVLDSMRLRSHALCGDGEFDAIWNRHCADQALWYLNWLDCIPTLLRKVDRRLNLSPKLRSPGRLVSQHNVIACESHREMLLTALERDSVDQASGRPK